MQSFLVWGFGKTGKALLNFFLNQQSNTKYYHKIIYIADKQDKKKLTEYIPQNSTNITINIISELEAQTLINEDKIDYFLLSPGIEINEAYYHHKKHFSETKLFNEIIKTKNVNPSVAITGSLGKTTITSFIHQAIYLQNQDKNYFLGGNIGNPLINIAGKLQETNGYVIELSNAQLKFTKENPWNIGIITNLYPNHLNMHKDFKDYILSKVNIYKYNPLMNIILSNQAYEILKNNKIEIPITNSIIIGENYTSDNISCTYIKDNKIIFFDSKNNLDIILLNIQDLPQITYTENWLIILTTLFLINPDNKQNFKTILRSLIPVEHRLEYIGHIAKRHWYNDSKSTLLEATLEGTKELIKLYNAQNVWVIVGGLSKGVDRATIFKQLLTQTTNIILYGKTDYPESDLIKLKNIYEDYCSKPIHIHTTLEDLIQESIKKSNENNVILFSPGGASFDFYTNFEHRGTEFKKMSKY